MKKTIASRTSYFDDYSVIKIKSTHISKAVKHILGEKT